MSAAISANIQLDRPLPARVKQVDEKLSWECDITGNPVPRYTWLKDGGAFEVDGQRISITPTDWGSKYDNQLCITM